MTKTVKKRLQAVVALLVCFMVLFAAFPSVPFTSEVKAADCYIYFNQTNDNQHTADNNNVKWSNKDATKGTSGAIWLHYWGGSGSSAYDEKKKMEGTTDGDWQIVGCKLDFVPANIQFIVGTSSSPSVGSYYSTNITSGVASGDVYMLDSSDDGYGNNQDVYKSASGKSYTLSSEATPDPPSTSDKSILVGVKYYNYFYDEQIEYEKANGTADPTKLKVTDGQAKNPYTYFNRAVMASDYGGNNVKGRTSNNPTSYPVMYLGEFWLGGGAENNGLGYESAPTVSAGKYDRSDGVTSGDISRGSRTLQDEDGNNSKSVSISVQNDTLTNFYWGANLAARGSNSAQQYYHIVAQGLVDDTLSMDPTSPNYLVPTINGQRIPYFDEKFLDASTNSDLASITGTQNGVDVGRVYTSIFPFYRKDVEFTTSTDFTKSAWHNSWIREGCSGDNWGRSLTAGTISAKSEYYTFNSKTDTVSVNPDGGATSDPGNATGGYGTTYHEMSLDAAAANSSQSVFKAANVSALATKYSVANYNAAVAAGATGDALPPVIEGHTNETGSYDVTHMAQKINTYKNGSMFDDDEVALLTIAGFFDNTGDDAGHVKDVDGQYGYFPFNSSSDSLKQLQYGFGTRLDIRFNISKDGLTTEGAPEIFRFTGDDDVWVFIDGKLVLDMGGGHKNAIGEINFKDCKAAVLFAGDAQTNDIWAGSDMSSMVTNSGTGISTDSKGITTYGPTSEIGQLLTNIKNEAAGGISEDHTLTMFYMERGKLNSNMSVMFNFKAPDIIDITDPTKDFPATPDEIPDPNPVTTSKLKIREISNFENVNPGLIGLTKKAAEDDVFKYSISSNIQRTVDMASSWVLSPSKDTYVRTAETDSTKTTTLSTGFVAPNDSGSLVYVKLRHSGSTDYMEAFNNCKATALWIDLGSSSHRLVLGRKIDNYLFAYEIPNGLLGNQYPFRILYANDDAAAAKFVEGTTYPSGVNFNGSTAPNARRSLKSTYKLSSNDVYTVATWNNSDEFNFISEGTLSDLTDAQKYAVNNFLGNGSQVGVANTNYVWKEAFTTKTGSSDSRLVNTTTADGTFNLLYGTSDDANESSALFINQFYKASPYSNFTVSQSMAKRQPSVAVNSYTDADRSMGKYYSTKASTVKRNAPIGTGTSNMTGTLVEDLLGGATVTGQSSVASGDISVNSPDMDIIISNYINVANLYIRKESLKYEDRTTAVDLNSSPEVANDEYYFKVYIWDVFGKVGNNVTDYSAVKYIIDGNTANQISMINYPSTGTADYGILKIKAGQTAAITGIPEGTLCWVEEMHKSKLFKDDSNWNDNSDWEAEYNLDHNDGDPSVTTKIMTDQQTESTLDLPTFVQSITKDADGNTLNSGFTYGGVIYGWRVTGAQSNPQYKRALYSAQNSVKNPDPGFSVNPIILIVEKVWETTETLEETTVKFVVEYQSVADGSPLSSDEADWNKYNYDNNNSDGIVTLNSSDLVSGVSSITWRKTITNSAPDKADENHTYYYRIREWGKNDAVFIYKDGGFYSENFMAVYGDGTAESPVTNLGNGDTTASAGDSYRTVVTTTTGTAPNTTTTYTLTLTIKNEYRSTMAIDPKPLPKTGAAGVYAIVTFGAFAITIAGVALLIYRKKLQTVNIYAVKGSEKPKE